MDLEEALEAGFRSNATQLQAWRRATLAIDDYRRHYGRGSEADALGDLPRDERAARAYDLASTAISRFEAVLEPGRSLER